MAKEPPSKERLRDIAVKRLKELGVQVFVTQGTARGRLLLKPERFKAFPGAVIEPVQHFVTHEHAFVVFSAPSPLQHLGGVRFFEAESAGAFLVALEKRWLNLLSGTHAALDRARRFRLDAQIEPGSWMLESHFHDPAGQVVLRFDGRVALLYVFRVGETVLQYGPEAPPIAMQLPQVPSTVDDRTVVPLVRAARARVGLIKEEVEAGAMSLDLSTIDVRPDGTVRVAATAIPKGDMSLDLDVLKTGDLHAVQEIDLEGLI